MAENEKKYWRDDPDVILATFDTRSKQNDKGEELNEQKAIIDKADKETASRIYEAGKAARITVGKIMDALNEKDLVTEQYKKGIKPADVMKNASNKEWMADNAFPNRAKITVTPAVDKDGNPALKKNGEQMLNVKAEITEDMSILTLQLNEKGTEVRGYSAREILGKGQGVNFFKAEEIADSTLDDNIKAIAAEIAAGDFVKEAPAYTAPKPKYNDPLRTIANDLREKCEKDGGVTTNKYGEKNGTPTASVWYQKATFTEDKKLDKASYVNIGVDNADGSKTTVKLMNMHGNIVAAVNNGTKGEDGKWNFEDNGFVNSLEDAEKLPEAVKSYIVSDVLKLDSEFAKTVAELNAEYANGEKDTEGKPTTAAYYNNLSDTIFIKDAVAGNIEFGRDEKGEITINEVTKGEDGKNVRTAINALDVKSEFQSAVDKVLANEDRTANKDNIERD